jgi:hypothetical protein
MSRITRLVPLVIVVGLTVGACSSNSSNDSPVIGAAQSATTTTGPAASPTTATPATTAATVKKVNANSASQAEVQAALADAGVPSPAQWAREVVEYRPYPTTDPTFAKLRQNLVKYNPGPGVVDQIVAVLAL